NRTEIMLMPGHGLYTMLCTGAMHHPLSEGDWRSGPLRHQVLRAVGVASVSPVRFRCPGLNPIHAREPITARFGSCQRLCTTFGYLQWLAFENVFVHRDQT